MTSLRFFFTALCVAAFFVLGSCAARHDDPPLYTYDIPVLTLLSAQAHAKDIEGIVYHVENTHSMEPLLQGGDYVVVDTHVPFAAIQRGQLITYHASFSADPVTHRTQDKSPAGWACHGDNVNPNANPETYTVTEKDYMGKVAGIYRFKP